ANQRGAGSKQRYYLVAGSYHVRLHREVDIGRTLRAIARDLIVATWIGCHRFHRADRDRTRAVAGRQDRSVSVPAQVAGRDHHDDAAIPGGFHRLTERILITALINRTAQRKI